MGGLHLLCTYAEVMDILVLGGLTFLTTSAISVLRASAAFWSSLWVVTPVATMMSILMKGIPLGAIAKDNQSARTSS